MPPYKAPKFFTERVRQPVNGANQILHVVDRFFLDRGVQPPVECCILLNSDGYLTLEEISDQKPLPNHIRTQLAFDEIANRSSQRLVNVRSLHLLNVQLVEQPVNTEGINDPVVLQGTLSYAFGAVEEVITGDLIVSRGDLLDSIVGGIETTFQYAVEGGQGKASRCFHLMLPGNRAEATEGGVDLVMAYPLLPVELIDKTPGNEALIQKVLLEVLTALQHDLREENTLNPLLNENLRSFDREKTIQDLMDRGYAIAGDIATKHYFNSSWMLLKELMNRFGPLATTELQLPPQNCLDDLLYLTARSIDEIEGWPPVSALAVRRCYRRMF